jgi:hypothetical protein
MKRKWLAIGIILLFIGTCIFPSTGYFTILKKIQNDTRSIYDSQGSPPDEEWNRTYDVPPSRTQEKVYACDALGYESGWFELATPGTWNSIAPTTAPSFISAGCWADGQWYVSNYGTGTLYTIDPDTGEFTTIGGSATNGYCGIAYDDSQMYGVTWNGSASNLYSIDKTTGNSTLIGSCGYFIYIDIAMSVDGILYGHDIIYDQICTIDPATGASTVVGPTDIYCNYAQGASYDLANSMMYLAAYTTNGPELYTVDTTTGHATFVGAFPMGMEIDGFAIPWGYPPPPHLWADFTWTPPDPFPEEIVLFNASASYDSQGNITLYEWDWNNDEVYEENHTTPIATHSWADSGLYRVGLRVSDDIGSTAKKIKTVTVNHAPEKPIINGPTYGMVNHEYTFSVNPIIDPDGDSMYCQWKWGDGNITDWLGPYSSGEAIYASYNWFQKGTYELRVKLKDKHGFGSNWSDIHLFNVYNLKKAFIIGRYTIFNVSGNEITIVAVNLWVIYKEPTSFDHYPRGTHVTFLMDTAYGRMYPKIGLLFFHVDLVV